MARHVSGFSAAVWLAAAVCFIFCCASCSAASVRIEDGERKPWLDDAENDIYFSELVNRLRALDAEEAGLAQYELDNYFRKHVPFFHLFSRVPASPAVSRSVLAGKRGIDFGLGRGFSATQAAKHRMALEAASAPSGPGRRRRAAQPAGRH